MRLSIITINYNNRDGLKKTIESVVGQSFTDYEWIVVDGGSTDGSKELIEQNSDHFSYWVSESDKGIYNAMNKGIMVAKGDYLQFLNSGDWLYDCHALERCFSHHFESDIAYGNLFFVDKNGEKTELSDYPQQLSLRFLYQSSLGHNASFIRRELLQSVLYDEHYKIVSDWVFFLKMALSKASFVFLDEIITCFDTSGISSINEQLVQEERAMVIKDVIPLPLIQDFKKMDEMERILNKDHVKKVLEYGGKSKFYHKLISAVLSFIGYVDKVASHPLFDKRNQ